MAGRRQSPCGGQEPITLWRAGTNHLVAGRNQAPCGGQEPSTLWRAGGVVVVGWGGAPQASGGQPFKQPGPHRKFVTLPGNKVRGRPTTAPARLLGPAPARRRARLGRRRRAAVRPLVPAEPPPATTLMAPTGGRGGGLFWQPPVRRGQSKTILGGGGEWGGAAWRASPHRSVEDDPVLPHGEVEALLEDRRRRVGRQVEVVVARAARGQLGVRVLHVPPARRHLAGGPRGHAPDPLSGSSLSLSLSPSLSLSLSHSLSLSRSRSRSLSLSLSLSL